MSMHPPVSSPRYILSPSLTSRPSTTPAGRPLHQNSSSVGQPMPPLLSPNVIRSPAPTSTRARTPSPNYFGFQFSSDSTTEATHHTRQNWSPPSSAVRSTAAFSPTIVPADQNPEYDAFRRQSEGKAFNLGSLHNPTSPQARTPNGRTWSGKLPESPKATSEARAMPPPLRPSTRSELLDPDMANLGRSPKRHLSSDSTNFPEPPRKASPAGHMIADQLSSSPERGISFGSPPERQPRNSLPPRQAPPAFNVPRYRAETLPPNVDGDSSVLATPQHIINLLESSPEQVLILDLRVSTQYARSRITGALNLCIPTTLLKRPSFNVQKLAETFKSNDQRSKFENWRDSKYIVVYDAAASQLKDAAICINTIKKFDGEGYEGTCYIIKGGFAELSRMFPTYIDRGAESASNTSPLKLSLESAGPQIAPVIGGCPLPATQSAANPFFGNIRQNMDLIGGVGQIPLKIPSGMSTSGLHELPTWLQVASEENDGGAKVSDKFLQIEKREQKRMQAALSGKVSYGTPNPEAPKAVQIAGIEKGSKNRYNNIWPYEHSRVKLEDVPSHECDYVNANHVKAPLSNKRYIATQGPIPATFEDFWNMIWQQDVRVIVMLTAEKEGGQIKAHNYWTDTKFGPFVLDQLSEKRASLESATINRHRNRPSSGSSKSTDVAPQLSRADSSASPNSEVPYVIVRKLTLSHTGEPFARMREITQLQYSSWPDFGAPAHPAHLLGLVEQCDAVVRMTTGSKHSEPDPPISRPVLVHCSAGCGRTGTFCTVDSVIDMLKRQRAFKRTRQGTPMDVDSSGEQDQSPFFASSGGSLNTSKSEDIDGDWVTQQDTDLIEKTVENFRRQRLSMVQSLRQYVLCYESVMEWIMEQDRV